MSINTIRAPIMALIASSMISTLVFAGAADMTTADGNSMKFEYQGENLRINTGQEGSYMVINNDGMYVISNADGRMMVIDAGKMMGMFGDMAATAPSVADSKVVSLDATGQHEKHAGITGEVYNLEYIDDETGKKQVTQLVLSDDPRAISLTTAITGMAAAMAKAAGQEGDGINELQEHMRGLNKGVLRYGDDMWVTAISDRKIDSARFTLPTAPTDMSSLGGMAEMLKNIGDQQSTSTEPSADPEKTKGLVSDFLSTFGK